MDVQRVPHLIAKADIPERKEAPVRLVQRLLLGEAARRGMLTGPVKLRRT